jgi:hypothetical protein
MTHMGKPYYPVWLDNLADDVILELEEDGRAVRTIDTMC